MISGVAMMFFASYVLACSLNPLVDRLSRKMKRPLAASIVVGGMIAIFVAFFMPVIIIASKQITSFVQVLPSHIEAIKSFKMQW